MNLCGYEIAPGEKKNVWISVPQANAIDAVLCCGKHKGKTLVITAGVHGCEYVGIEAARRLAQMLNPSKLCGNVILLPLVNQKGFLEGAKQVMPEDCENLNRAFPGKENGTLSSRVAYAIEQYVYPYADFLIDLHSGDCNESLVPLVFYPIAGEQAVNEKALAAAKALSVPYRVRSTAKNGLYSWAVQKQIPALLIERGANGLWSEQEVTDCMNDVDRIMSHFRIINQSYVMVEQTEITQAVYEQAKCDGFWYPHIVAGQKVHTGECLGYLKQYPDGEQIEIRAKFNGVVLYYTTALGIRAGESLVAYGRT